MRFVSPSRAAHSLSPRCRGAAAASADAEPHPGPSPPAGSSNGRRVTDQLRPADQILGYVPGAWDMFHVGHLNILLRARERCDRLVVGVVTDDALFEAKGKHPVVPLEERMEVVRHLAMVDDVVVDFSSNKLRGLGAGQVRRAVQG